MKIVKPLAALAIAGLGFGLMGCSTNSDEPIELVVTSFGADWEKVYIDAVVEPFEKEHNVEISLVTLYSADALAQMTAQKGDPKLDVVHFSGGQETVAAENGLIQKIDSAALSNLADLHPLAAEGVANGEGPAIHMTPVGLLYRTDQIDAPTSWKDLFQPEYSHHVALTDLSSTYGVLSMLAVNEALGSDIGDVTPALDALGKLAASGDAIVGKTTSDLQQAFSARDVWIAPYMQDAAEVLRQAGMAVGFAVPEEGAVASYITANVVAGGAHTDLATKLVDYSLRPEVQAKYAEALLYSPTNTKTEIPAEFADKVMLGDELNSLIQFDGKIIADQRGAWADSWNERIAR